MEEEDGLSALLIWRDRQRERRPKRQRGRRRGKKFCWTEPSGPTEESRIRKSLSQSVWCFYLPTQHDALAYEYESLQRGFVLPKQDSLTEDVKIIIAAYVLKLRCYTASTRLEGGTTIHRGRYIWHYRHQNLRSRRPYISHYRHQNLRSIGGPYISHCRHQIREQELKMNTTETYRVVTQCIDS